MCRLGRGGVLTDEKVSMQNERQVDKMLRAAKGASNSVIVIQDIPDPDAIASAEALKRLLAAKCDVESVIAHQGIVGRAENRGLLHYLHLPLAQISDLNLADFDLVATVDTQPQFGNNSLPGEVPCNIVIDHHRDHEPPPGVDFVDIRPVYGATSTILTEYIRFSDVRLDVHLATALLYGIKSDTQDLGRESTQADIDAYLFLYPHADKAAISGIEHERVSRAYFLSLHEAIEQSRLYGPALICCAGRSCGPEIIAEVADLLMRLAGVDYVLCYGVCKDQIVMSLRADRKKGNAHGLIREIVEGIGTGGGHEMFAGGQVALGDASPEKVIATLEERFLTSLNLARTEPIRLVPDGPHDKQSEEGNGV